MGPVAAASLALTTIVGPHTADLFSIPRTREPLQTNLVELRLRCRLAGKPVARASAHVSARARAQQRPCGPRARAGGDRARDRLEQVREQAEVLVDGRRRAPAAARAPSHTRHARASGRRRSKLARARAPRRAARPSRLRELVDLVVAVFVVAVAAGAAVLVVAVVAAELDRAARR